MGKGTSPRVLAGKATLVEGTNTYKMEVTEFENANNFSLKVIYSFYYEDGSFSGSTGMMKWHPRNPEKSAVEHTVADNIKTIKAGFCTSEGYFIIGSEGILLER